MRERFMRILIFFDLPVETSEDRKEYRRFRKFLIKEGFVMMQESVYSKLALNSSALDLIVNKIKREKPKEGLVQILNITEKQFASIINICGENKQNVIESASRLVVL